MKTIIVAIDFSENSKDALRYAYEYVQMVKNRDLILYHAAEITRNEDLPHLEEQLSEWASEILKEVSYSCIINQDKLDEGIQQLIKQYDVCMVMMGVTGKNKLGQLLIGSQVFKLVETSTTPILIIPNNTIFEPIHHVALAIPFIPELKERIPHEEIKEWLKSIDASLTIINVGHKREDKQAIYQGLADMFEMFDEEDPEYHFPSGSNVADLILDYVYKNEVQMIVSISGSYGFLERLFKPSVTKKIAFSSKVPIKVYPQNKID